MSRLSLRALDTTGASDGDVPTYDSVNDRLVYAAPSGGGGATSLDALSDVDTSTNPPAAGDALVYNGTDWIPGTSSSGGTSTGVLLLENSGSVPTGTAINTIIYRKPPSLADYESVVLADSPAVYYATQDTSGTVAADSSGNARPGSYNNGAGVNDALDPAPPVQLGKHVRLDGTNDFIGMDGGSWFTPESGFTAEGWFRIRNWGTYWERFFDFNDPGQANVITFGRYSTSTADAFVAVGSTNYRLSGGLTAVALNTWFHLALTLSSAGLATMYVNGGTAASVQAAQAPIATRVNRWVGQSPFTSDSHLAASIAHVAVHNTVLSAARLKARQGNGGGLAGWWDGSVIQPFS